MKYLNPISLLLTALIVLIGLFTASCQKTMSDQNPLLKPSSLPLEAPEFDAIKIEHYRPAFEQGMKEELEEIATIANNPDAPTFENTIVAMEKSGELLGRTSSVFYNLTSSNTNDQMQEIQTEMAPKLSQHSDAIMLNKKLFSRVETLYKKRPELDLDPASLKLLEDDYRDFVRAGAQLTPAQKERMKEINQELSSAANQFQDNLLKMTQNRVVIVDDPAKLDGLSEARIAATKEAAKERGYDDKYLLSIANTTRVPMLSSLKNRKLREELWKASAYRGIGENGGIDNRPLIKKLVALRAERAELLGYNSYAAYALDPQTAHTPEAALSMMKDLAPAVVKNTKEEAKEIQRMMKKDGLNDELKPWDWEYYAEKVRQDKYEYDESQVRPYFELDRVLKDGVFFTMNKLYGITYEERFDLPVYHPDVRVFNVYDKDGSQLGLFYADYFTRDSKSGGAWMNAFVSQSELLNKKPVVVNVLNITPPAEGEPALISFDNVTTMFHEMGHAVHGLFSDVKYPSQSGTSVPRDYVEFPSTFEEDWAIQPEVIENYAYHYKTGERIPQELLDKVIAARGFNQGFDTQEYLAAALVDMEWHLLGPDEIPDDVEAFEQKSLKKYGLDMAAVPPRYKSPYFAHIFSGGYSANYYAYIWSEILAADAFAYMQENGGLKLENGQRLRTYILSKGGSQDAMKLYGQYREGEPDVKYLLIRRGLNAE